MRLINKWAAKSVLGGANTAAATLFPARLAADEEESARRFKGRFKSAKFSAARNRSADREKLTGC